VREASRGCEEEIREGRLRGTCGRVGVVKLSRRRPDIASPASSVMKMTDVGVVSDAAKETAATGR